MLVSAFPLSAFGFFFFMAPFVSMGITPLQFKQMQERLGGSRRAAAPVFERTDPVRAQSHQVILGVDPSLRWTGYGVSRLSKPTPRTLACGPMSSTATRAHSLSPRQTG